MHWVCSLKTSPLPCQPFCLISSMIPFLFSGFKLLLPLTSLLPQNLSPSQRPLCVIGRLRRKIKKARGARWEGEREKRGLFPFPIVICTRSIFRLLLFWWGYPAGDSAEERAAKPPSRKDPERQYSHKGKNGMTLFCLGQFTAYQLSQTVNEETLCILR